MVASPNGPPSYIITFIYCPLSGAIHQNADEITRLPPIVYLASEEDHIYVLISRANV